MQTDLGDRLLPCFNSPSRVPFSDVNLQTGHAHAPRWGPDSSTSEVTTIQIEFRDLSMVTGDPKYKVFTSERLNWLPRLRMIMFSRHRAYIESITTKPKEAEV